MNTNLNRQNIEDIYPLSPLQQGMLFHSLYAPDSGAYVVQVSYELHGSLNIPAFDTTWQYLINRYPVLRTAFVWDKLEKPLQVVGKQVEFSISHLDWCNFTGNEQQESLKSLLQKQREQGFNLSQAPLMQITLIKLTNTVYQFVWSYHHLLLDGWSVQVLLKDFLVIYQAYSQEQTPVLANPRRYRDYIAWLQQQDFAESEIFWKQQLQGFLSPTRLNIEQNRDVRPDNLHSHYSEQNIQLSVELSKKLDTLAKQQQLTINTFVQGAWALLLSRYSGEKDILFATVCAGRPGSLINADSMVGLFINTLPFRVLVSPEESLYKSLQKLQHQQVEIREYEYCSLVDIHRWSEVSRSLPLFETLVVFENYPIEPALKQSLDSLEIRNIQAIEQTNYPLTLYATVDSQLSLRLLYDRDRYHNTTITQILEQLETLLLGMTQGNCTLAALPILSPTQQQQILIDWNATTQEIPQQCVHEIISQQAAQTPDATAVVFGDKTLTYAELNAKSNQIAHFLLQMGVKPEARIGVYLERSSPLLIIALLGILKAGAAYVPLDPTFPPERLRFMMADAQLTLLLTQTYLNSIITHELATVNLDQVEENINQQPIFDPQVKVTPEQVTYLIYTSGSTGKPKGVMIEGRSLVNILTDLKQRLSITPTDKLLAITTIAFDIAALELFLPLIAGAQIVLAPQTLDPTQLATCIEQNQITVMQATPATWRLLITSGWRGKVDLKILCGGEALDNTLAQQLLSCTQEVWNLYGPTETTIWSAAQKLSIDEPVTIGHPIANTQFYVLDEHLQPLPIGVPGELYISGAGVARGYWKRPDLTAERFLLKSLPLCAFAPLREKTLYKTGDRVRYLENGKLEYLGRLDHQIKIRGFRIELGEIEAVLTEHPAVNQAVVTLREQQPGEPHLLAYIVPKTEIILTEIRSYLGEKLPTYMIPAAFIELEKLPLTPNGKINRKALPTANNLRLAVSNTLVLPQTEIEQTIANIWKELLTIENLSIHDNFFDLGGHSLLIVRMQGQLHLQLNQNIPLVDLFRHPTINALAKYLTQKTPSPNPETTSRIAQLQNGKQRLLQQRQTRLKT
ncbi:amino acid adenylation domain-containing protein [Nodularia sphaerocarpa]|uniref:amino acid adenylation domain-containing protein n=2 Tax=Nodularia sphaerocarpa TaxID=137816 RepID=UPI00232C4651|nr:amino acid adenylation domain-containing protein [Nodularia sphaerocarpa]MDB9374692.1 amino acid adenylation domain-containing protein [Nodularia sphaerocarpa CS-585]